MREFIPIEKVDPIYFESSYYTIFRPTKGLGQARVGSSLPVFQRRDPRLRRDSEREDIKLPSEQLELGRGLNRENVFGGL